MNYIQQVNTFWLEYATDERMSPTSVAIYFALLHLNNISGWRKEIRVYPREIMELTGIETAKTYHYHLKRLRTLRLIEYTPGKNQYQPTKVLLPCLYPAGKEQGQNLPEHGNGMVTAREEQASEAPVFSGVPDTPKPINNKTIKHKTKKGAFFSDLEKQILEEYEGFVKKRTGHKAKLTDVDRGALEQITGRLHQSDSKNPATIWRDMLAGWGKLSPYYQAKLSLEQIEKNFLSILEQIRNHDTSNQGVDTTVRSHSERKEFRI